MQRTDRTVILEDQTLTDGLKDGRLTMSDDMMQATAQHILDSGIQRMQIAILGDDKQYPHANHFTKFLSALRIPSGVKMTAHVLSKAGIEEAQKAGIDHITIGMSVSEAEHMAISGQTLEEAQSAFMAMLKIAKSKQMKVRGDVRSVFGCRREGPIDPRRVMSLVRECLDAGVDEIGLVDTSGMADPFSMNDLMASVAIEAFDVPRALHLHNTENKGLANAYAAVKTEVRLFDTTLGGLGTCSFFKGLPANIATEDMAHMLHQMGFETGIDNKKMAGAAQWFEQEMATELPGALHKILNK